MPSYLQATSQQSQIATTTVSVGGAGSSGGGGGGDGAGAGASGGPNGGYVPLFQYQPSSRSVNRESYAEPASSTGNKCWKCNVIRDVCHCSRLVESNSSYVAPMEHVHSTQSNGNGAGEPTQFFELSSTSTASATSTLSATSNSNNSNSRSDSGSFIPNHSQRKTEVDVLSQQLQHQQQQRESSHTQHPEYDNRTNNININRSNSVSHLGSIWTAAMDDHAVDEQLMQQSRNSTSSSGYELPSSSLLSSHNSSSTSSSFEASSSNSNNNINSHLANGNATAFDDVTSSASDTEHVQFANTRTTNTTTTTSALQKKKHQSSRNRNGNSTAAGGNGTASAAASSSVIDLDATPSTSAQAQQHHRSRHVYRQRLYPSELDPAGDNSSDDGWDLRMRNAATESTAGRPQSTHSDLEPRHTDHTYFSTRGYTFGGPMLPFPPPDVSSRRSNSASCSAATHTTCSGNYNGREICGVPLTTDRGVDTPISEQQQHPRTTAVLKFCFGSGRIVRTRVRSMDEPIPAANSSGSSSNHSLCQPPRKLARLEPHNDVRLSSSSSTMSSLSPTNFYAFQPGRHRHRTYAELARSGEQQVSERYSMLMEIGR